MAQPETRIERAVFVAEARQMPAAGEGCDRLYVGSEFCTRRLPDPAELRDAVEQAQARGMAFSLVTPLLDEEGLEATLALALALPPVAGAEVVANDVGLLQALAREHWPGTVVAGRLLTRQHRGTGFKTYGEAPPDARTALRHCALDSSRFIGLLAERYGVRRFELDNLVQGVEIEQVPEGIAWSVYHPYLFVAASRRCPWRFDGKRWRPRAECVAPCCRRVVEMVPEEGGETILLGGCAQFLQYEGDVYRGPGVDRHVFEPAVPA